MAHVSFSQVASSVICSWFQPLHFGRIKLIRLQRNHLPLVVDSFFQTGLYQRKRINENFDNGECEPSGGPDCLGRVQHCWSRLGALISERCVHRELKPLECNPVLGMPSQNCDLTILVEQWKPKVSLVNRCGNPQLQLVFHSLKCSDIARWAWFER